jgi:hypothetical protein
MSSLPKADAQDQTWLPNNHGLVENPKLNSTLILIAVKQQMVVSMKVSPATAQTARIAAAIDKLASFTEVDRPIRGLFSAPNLTLLETGLPMLLRRPGLVCHIDSGGNLIGTRPANLERADEGKASRAKVLIGSHIDTVPAGGRFDGIAGVIAALEVVHYLNEHQIELPFDLEIVDYLGEELNVWGTSCLGSRHMAGLLTPEILGRVDADGRQLAMKSPVLAAAILAMIKCDLMLTRFWPVLSFISNRRNFWKHKAMISESSPRFRAFTAMEFR